MRYLYHPLFGHLFLLLQDFTPLLYIIISIVNLFISYFKMQSPIRHDKTTFQSELRKRDAEFRLLSQENFDLKLQIHQLQLLIQSKAEPRRASASPPTDNFYDFSDNEDGASGTQKDVSSLSNNPITRKLRRELADLRAENDALVEKNHHLNDTLDDLREKNIADMEKAAEKLKGQHAEMQTLVNQGEDLQSENLHLRIEVSQARDTVESVKAELEREKEIGQEKERRELAMRSRADGFYVQFKAAEAALEEEKMKAQRATLKMEEGSMQLVKVRKQLEKAGTQTGRLKDELEKVKRERGVVQESLKREKERAAIWKETEKLVEEGKILFRDGGELEELINVLREQRERYDGMEYQPAWREMIMGDLNDCLRMLYRSQRQVEARRHLIVDKFLDTPLHRNYTQLS